MNLIFWAAVVLIGLSGPAEAGPLVAAIGAAAGWVSATLAAGGWAAAFLRLAIGVALSALQRALMPKPKKPGIKTDVSQTGGTNPQTFILGRYATAGTHACPPMSYAWDNTALTFVLTLAETTIHNLSKVFIDSEEVPFDNFYSTTNGFEAGFEAQGRLDGRAWLKWYDGTQTVVDPYLMDAFGDYPDRPWQNDMVFPGVAYAIMTFAFDTNRYSGFPTVRFEVEGMALYDPRKDSTAGGTGTHRLANPATWEFTENPAVMVYNILLGISLDDGSTWGMEVGQSALPSSYWFAAMNACDEEVARNIAGTRPRYRAGYEIAVSEEPLAVIEELMEACGGQVAEVGGAWVVSVGAPNPASAFVTDDDLLITEPREFEPFPGLGQTFNAVSATWPDPASSWEPSDASPLTNAAWEAEDGGRQLVANLQLDAVPYARQVRALMREMAADNRRFRTHVVSLPPWALHLNPLDTISWTSEFNGYSNKLFEIVRQVVDPETLNCAFLIRERDPSDYDPDATLDGVLPTSRPVNIIQPVVQGVLGWAVTVFSIADGNGVSRKPAIRLEWSPTIVAQSIGWHVVDVGTGLVVAEGTKSDVASGRATITDGLIPSRIYDIYGQAVTNRGSTETIPVRVTLPAAKIVVASDLANLVNTAAFTAGIRPVEIVDILPVGSHIQGRTVVLTTDNKLYRNTGAGWTKATDGGDITPLTVTTDAIAAGAIAAGAGKIGDLAVDTLQIAGNAVTVPMNVEAISNNNVFDGYWALLTEVNYPKPAGHSVRIQAGFQAFSDDIEDGRWLNFGVRILKDGVDIRNASQTVEVQKIGTNYFLGHQVFTTIDNTAAGGTFNYKLQFRFDPNIATAGKLGVSNITLQLVSFKK